MITSSAGMLENVDVSARPWFEAGLRGGFAGDVHDAVLLNRLLGGDESEPLRFIDFASPVQGVDGRVVGVLATHTSFAWVEQFLSETAAIRDIDLYLVNPTGEIVFATDAPPADVTSLQSLRSAATGVAAHIREVWPHGREYFSSIVPTVSYADLPSFGWRLVGRVPGDSYNSERRALLGTLSAIIAGAVGAFAVAATLFVLLFVRPLTRLVDSAERTAAGESVYPPESQSSAEAIRLSWALAQIQSWLGSIEHGFDVSGGRK